MNQIFIEKYENLDVDVVEILCKLILNFIYNYINQDNRYKYIIY
jgi:hypothetical protein